MPCEAISCRKNKTRSTIGLTPLSLMYAYDRFPLLSKYPMVTLLFGPFSLFAANLLITIKWGRWAPSKKSDTWWGNRSASWTIWGRKWGIMWVKDSRHYVLRSEETSSPLFKHEHIWWFSHHQHLSLPHAWKELDPFRSEKATALLFLVLWNPIYCKNVYIFDIDDVAANHRCQAVQPGGVLERQIQVTDAGARGRDGEGQGGGGPDEVVRRECQERTGEGNGCQASSKNMTFRLSYAHLPLLWNRITTRLCNLVFRQSSDIMRHITLQGDPGGLALTLDSGSM